ncbi:DUF1145 domain-containing protein [Parendozoicomonas sp. Alg238-R29]|uniref:DUF1145 domain-containing protein n=1 Tax=Parendozoicomonas sp. Alg238-R29 TaxID=2993446 RepID=UPI00248D877E|nr:DUF1145 domain-containing protein [Parendozoicomonas sp. Alg238-R29]
MKVMLAVGQLVTILFWGAVISTGFIPWSAPLDTIVPALGGLVFVAHLLEVVIWQKRIRLMSEHLASDNIKILIFGFFHMATMLQKQAELQETVKV